MDYCIQKLTMKLNSKAILRVPRENYTTKLTAETQGNKSHLFQVHEKILCGMNITKM